jgi:hypothetical protein
LSLPFGEGQRTHLQILRVIGDSSTDGFDRDHAIDVKRFGRDHPFAVDATKDRPDSLVGQLFEMSIVREVRSNFAIQSLEAAAPLPFTPFETE